MKISVITKDKYLRTEAELILEGKAELSFGMDDNADITLIDLDTVPFSDGAGRVIRLSRTEGVGDETIPLPFSFFAALTESQSSARLILDPHKRSCILDGETVKLTSHEYKLLSLIASG